MTPSGLHRWADSTPRWLGCSSGRLLDALGNESRLRRVAAYSSAPIVLVDDDRGFREANAAARLVLRLPLRDLRRLRIDDVTAADHMPVYLEDWARLTDTGFAAGRHQLSLPDGGRYAADFHALAGAATGIQLVAFAPAEWPADELTPGADSNAVEPEAFLTPRERELLLLAADGCTGPMIAKQLWVSPSTVRTHFEHIYEKLEVRDRAGAVARAMRLGLID